MDVEERLIEAVREFPCLWQVNCRAFRDAIAKENSWKEVSNQVGLCSEECQRKWKLMRDKFVRELRKTKEKKSGDPGPAYTSCWPLFEALTFLQETVRHRRTQTNIPQPLPVEDEEHVQIDNEDSEARHSSQSLCNSGPSGSGATCITPSHQELDVTPSGQPQTKKRKMIRADEVDDAMLLYMKEQSEERARRKREETDEDHFGRHVAASLKRLPNRARAMARLRIEEVLVSTEFPEPAAET